MKVAILGTENSHALAFARLIKEKPEKYGDIEIVGLYGYDESANRQIIDEGLAPMAAETPDAFLGKVDAILVTARHGDHHYEYALPYVQAGIPAFIDKPFTVDQEKTDLLIAEAKKAGANLCGGSSLKFMLENKPLREYAQENTVLGGYVAAPVNMVNPYGDFYFYAQHLTEILVSIFGANVRSVRAHRPDAEKNRASVLFHYENFDVHGQYSDSYAYTAAVICKEGAKTAAATDIVYCYEYELDEFAEMVRTGKMERSYEQLAYPSRLIAAIDKAFQTGEEVKIAW